MAITIALADFDQHRGRYRNLRMRSLNHQPSGVLANERDLNLFWQYFNDNSVEKITGDCILRAITWLHEERNNQAGSINRKISSLRSYLRFLRFSQIEGADGFPIESMPRAKEPYNGPIDVLAPEEVSKILDTIDRECVLGYRDFLLYTMLYRLGLRIGEVVRIDIKDIDFEKEILQIHGKGRRKRKLPLLPDIMDLVNEWLIYRSRLCNSNRLGALFISKKGNRLSIRTAQDNFQKLVAKAGPFSIGHVTPHSLRHAFATHAIEGDQDIFVLKAILGHASIKSTEIYVHPSLRVLKKAVNEHIASKILEEVLSNKHFVIRIQQVR